MSKYEKAFIYFDTNVLECRHSGKALFLSQFTVNPLYYEIESFVQTMGLNKKVELCIPEVVWMELQEHLISHYKSQKSSMEEKIVAWQKSFGNLTEINYTFKDCNTEAEYADYATSIAHDFLENPRVTAKIIPCPKDEATIQQIIIQAIQSAKPFRTAKANGKEYTDAGFKDALIINTILKYTEQQLGILVSNDKDFSEFFLESQYANLRVCSDMLELQTILSDEFNIVTPDMMDNILKTDEYLMRRILTEGGFDETTIYQYIKLLSCVNEEDNTRITFLAYINGAKYSFNILFNIIAKELLETSSEPVDESEVR